MSTAEATIAAWPQGEEPQFTFAFQPIVDIRARRVYSHEALVRGLNNEGAYSVILRYQPAQMTAFDAASRSRAIEVAVGIGLSTDLNLNFVPSAAASDTLGLNATVAAASWHGFDLSRLIMEATEVEAIGDPVQFAKVVNGYRRAGVRFAIDDFGAGYSGLSLLSEFQPDIVKLDMGLVRGIYSHGPRQAIVRAIIQVCTDLGIDFVVEGVETLPEYTWFVEHGVILFQGYLLARPGFECMPAFQIPG